MAENLLKSIVNGELYLESLFKLLKSKGLDVSDDLEAATSLNINLRDVADDFPQFFLDFLRIKTQWLFRKPLNAKEESSKNSSPHTPEANRSCLSELGSPILFDSFEAKDKVQYKQKSRGNLKVNVSPVLSPNDSHFKNSTPLKSQVTPGLARTPGAYFSSPCESPVFPSPPFHRIRGRNLNAERFQDDSSSKVKSKLSLGDFIVPASSKKGKGRRIKPTQVTSDKDDADNVFMKAPELASSMLEERLLLKKECENLQQQISNLTKCEIVPPSVATSSSKVATDPTPLMLNRLTLQTEETYREPIANQGVHEKLDTLAKIYSFLLLENFSDNIIMELHFLMTIVAKAVSDEEFTDDELFGSARNCVQFAVLTLFYLKEMIVLLSPSTLNLLAATPAIAAYSTPLRQYLLETCHSKFIQSSSVIEVAPGGNVSFQCDTDNIENFTSHANFTSFRKQRDDFYKLLQKWEANQSSIVNWPAKVKYIISIREDPTNLMHLARLFRNQLLASCISYNSPMHDSESGVLHLLPSADRGKLSRLEARLTGQGVKRGLVPSPDFHGRELFFKKFIEASGPSAFVSFLQLALLDELLRLNEVEFCSEGTDGFADEITQKRYLDCLTSTRLLSKFLAFAEFLPHYKNDEKEQLLEPVILLHCKLRERVQPLFNAVQCLCDAVQSHRLVLTVPWMVSYMAMMDRVSARLTAFKNVFSLLAGIQRSIPEKMSPAGKLLLQLSLGWLFQVSSNPDIKPVAPEPAPADSGLDELEVVSESALYTACPYLSELNAVLAGNAGTAPRHIRPTRQMDPTSAENLASKQLELRLEDNFLQNQTPSTRRSIQFVAERVASCCIKQLINNVLPSSRETVCVETRRVYKGTILQTKKLEALDFAVGEWEEQVEAVRASALWDICTSRGQIALRSLLGPDAPELSIQVACDLAVRQAVEKADSWMHTHILSGVGRNEAKLAIESQLFSTEEEKAGGFIDLFKKKEPKADFSGCIFLLQNVSWQALHGCLTPQALTDAVRVASDAVGSEAAPPTLERPLLCLVMDLLLFIFIRSPQLIPLGVRLSTLLQKLQIKSHADGPLSRILSPRNLELINTEQEMQRLISLLVLFLHENLLTINDIKEQIMKIITQELPQNLQRRLSMIVRSILDEIIDDDDDDDFAAKIRRFFTHTK